MTNLFHRPLSDRAKRAIFAQETGEAFIYFLTLSHDLLDAPIRVCSNGATIVKGGEDFLSCKFGICMPEENDGAISSVQLTIGNVDRAIVLAIRTINSAVDVMLELALAETPDVLEAGPFNFRLYDVEYDRLEVRGTLAYEDLLNEPYPYGIMDPKDFPGIF